MCASLLICRFGSWRRKSLVGSARLFLRRSHVGKGTLWTTMRVKCGGSWKLSRSLTQMARVRDGRTGNLDSSKHNSKTILCQRLVSTLENYTYSFALPFPSPSKIRTRASPPDWASSWTGLNSTLPKESHLLVTKAACLNSPLVGIVPA